MVKGWPFPRPPHASGALRSSRRQRHDEVVDVLDGRTNQHIVGDVEVRADLADTTLHPNLGGTGVAAVSRADKAIVRASTAGADEAGPDLGVVLGEHATLGRGRERHGGAGVVDGNGSELKLYGGAVPVDADAAESGTLPP